MRDNLFGLPIQYEPWNKESYLPLYIANNYEFFGLVIGKRHCIVIKPKEELATLPALKKQIAKIQEIDHEPVVLDLDSVTFYRRNSLVENNIPFITPKQIFLPFIGTMLTNDNEIEIKSDKFVVSTQQLFLFYMYNNKKRFYVSDAINVLPFTSMTLTRAVKQLESTNMFFVTKDGVRKVIEAKYTRKELFEKAKPFLLSPVRKWGYIDKKDVTEDMVFAGETALSKKTMLNLPKLITYAIWSKNFDQRKLTDELVDTQKQVRLELWSYNPKQFSKYNTADNLSVALSFTNINDERLEEAVEQLIKEVFEND